MLENLISVISVLLDIHNIFICSITGVRAIDNPPPTLVPTRHFHILCKICEHIYGQKLLLAQGGKRYAIKLFLLSICFIVKNTVSAQNEVPVAFQTQNLFFYHKILNSRKPFCENSNI